MNGSARLSLLSMLVLAGCGVDSTEAQTIAKNASPLEATFEKAAREYQVPVSVLKGIGWVETRLSARADLHSASGGVGLMQLVRRDDVDTLGEAARLTGTDEGRMRVDAHANIIGAAAVLRARFDLTRSSDPSLDATREGDWYQAVSLYPGFDSMTASTEYASDVFLAVEQGFEAEAMGGTITQRPVTSGWREHAPVSSVRRDAVKEYPGAVGWLASPNYSSGHGAYDFVLIHTMQGSYAGTKSWFQNTASGVSSHYIVRSSDGEITQMVEHRNTAWHAQCYNARSIGIEHEGYVADPGRWYTNAMYTESAKLTRWIADRHGIAKNRSHIIGHVEVPAQCNTGRHSDPGSGWNWTRYMQLVTGSAPTTGTGVLIGTIFTGGNNANRVSGAAVKVGTQTVTTGADGVYQFSLAPGSYTATVTKSGYGTATATRTVTAGAQVWGSMEINPSAATGTLKGTVYAYNPANAADMTSRIAGATVKVGTQTLSSASDGSYAFTLAPGTYTVTVTKAGYADNQVSRAVTANATIWGSVGLSTTSMADTQAPQVSITFPGADASLDIGRIDLKGTASDDRGAVATVKVALNGGAETSVPVTAGAFEIELQLAPGTNTIVVKGTDAAGNVGTATTTARFNAGVAGFVHLADDEATRIEGATVELREAGTGTVVSTVTTDASGAYYAPVMTVPADYLVVVKKAHYLTASETATVPESERLALNVAMTPGEDAVGEGMITFAEPADGATVTTDKVTLYGSVTGFEVTTVTVNDAPAELLGAGGFTASVTLSEGANTLTAVATSATGETVSAQLHLTRKTGTPGMSLTNGAKGGCGGCSTGFGFEAFALLALLIPLSRRGEGK